MNLLMRVEAAHGNAWAELYETEHGGYFWDGKLGNGTLGDISQGDAVNSFLEMARPGTGYFHNTKSPMKITIDNR